MASFALSSASAAALSRLPFASASASSEREWLESPALLQRTLSALFSDPSTVATLRAADGRVHRPRWRSFEPGEALPLAFGLRQAPALPAVLTLGTPFAAYAFTVTSGERREDAWATALPERALVLRRRGERRLPAPKGTTARFHEGEGGRLGPAIPVRELSFGALSLATRRPVTVGEPARIVLRTPEQETLELRGRVARVGGSRGAPNTVLVLDPQSAHGPRWQGFVGRALHPNTRWGKTWAASSWALYEHSGYFQLSKKTPAHFCRLKAAFAQACRRLDRAPELGGQITWPSARGVEASLSFLRLYPSTALLYQVARRKDGPASATGREVLRELNLHAFEQLRRGREEGWILIFVQDDGARWSRLAYCDFGARLAPSRGCVVPFRAVELKSGAPRCLAREGLRVEEASPEQRAHLLAELQRTRPPAYLDALALRGDDVGLSGLAERWHRRGLTRRRAIRVVSRGGRPLAASVLELADEGLHLFGLLDSVRLYPLRPGAEALFPLLLDDARGWFHAFGKEGFVYLPEGDERLRPTGPEAEDLGTAQLIAFPKAELPAFLDHLHQITAPRPERSRA